MTDKKHIYGIDLEADRRHREAARIRRLAAAEAAKQAAHEDWLAHEPLISGLRDGDLLPMAQHLRAGKPLPQFVADELAEMIEGQSLFFNIYTQFRRAGPAIGWSAALDMSRERLLIGIYAEKLAREFSKGGTEAAISATMAKFGVSRTKVNDCRKALHEVLSRVHADQREEAWLTWLQIYSGDLA